jgi:erythronate-4-phosphate dehydrogenase
MVVNALMSFFSLPSENWYPGNVPEPPEPEIFIDCNARSDADIVEEVILHTYKIGEDDRKFRLSPSGFEKQRGDYPLRREFPSFSVQLANSSGNVRLILEKMGFNIRV